MKKNYLIIGLLISILFSCNESSRRNKSENKNETKQLFKKEILDYQKELNAEFADSIHSPLDSADRVHFISLKFFEPDYNYKVKARFIRTEGEKPFKMPTTTERMPEYIKYGLLQFKILEKEYELYAYQNIELVKKEAYKNYLFVPFTDLTNGFETYGGGRYMDIHYHGEDSLNIDFNKAYNPYCAYSGRWSCPIPPKENHLETKILAGVKSFHQ